MGLIYQSFSKGMFCVIVIVVIVMFAQAKLNEYFLADLQMFQKCSHTNVDHPIIC